MRTGSGYVDQRWKRMGASTNNFDDFWAAVVPYLNMGYTVDVSGTMLDLMVIERR